jgi:hypothetical protein
MPFARTRTRSRTRWSGRKTREGRSVQGRFPARAEGFLALTSELRGRVSSTVWLRYFID